MKNKLARTIFSCLFLITALQNLGAQNNPENDTVILVFDASGSMWGKLDGRAKIEIAREAIAKLVDEMPQKTMLGLVAYGHRKKGDCDDIEMLIPPGTLDRQTFIKTVNAIQPKGMTPLTAAVEFAAEALRSTEKKATVILVTDGEETCDRDPCQAARALEESGVDFTAHVIAFDLDLKAARTVECMAKETGGLFLTANSATALVDALQIVVQAPAEPPPHQDPGTATLSAPKSVIAGSFFEVEWSGPDDMGDYILLTVPEDKKVDNQTTYEYTRQGSPMRHKAIIYDGDAELRYIHGPTQKILAREAIKIIPAEVTLQAKKSAIGGSMIQVEWKGPDNAGDYIAIVPKVNAGNRITHYTMTKEGSPLSVQAPVVAGAYEIRYMTGQGDVTLAAIPLQLEKAEVTISAPQSAIAASMIEVEWTGPDNAGDYIAIVPKVNAGNRITHYTMTKEGSPLSVQAPAVAGDYEIRYMTGQGDVTLAAIPLQLEKAEVTISAPQSAVAGSMIEVEWTGPDNAGDYIAIVPKVDDGNLITNYTMTKEGSPLSVQAPVAAGAYEIRYMTGQGDVTLAAIPLQLEKAEVTISAPQSAVAGSMIQVEWTGPDNKGDYITIVPQGAHEGAYESYAYTSDGSPAIITAPEKTGKFEIRYVSGQRDITLARKEISITAAE